VADGTVVLQRCFAAVFPELPPEEISSASVDNVPAWDSLASLTLVAVLEDEFGVEISELDLPGLTSFVAVREYLQRKERLSA
jgi:acyl carrier protein